MPQPFETFFEELYSLFAEPAVWRVYPDVLEVLQGLQARGVTLGVLSNWDTRLEPLLEGLGLMSYFKHIVLSAVIGWEKPHPRIFASALELAGVPAAEVLHVGDNYQQDVIGARQAGIYAVWLRRRGERQADCPVIGSLSELLAIVDGRDHVPSASGEGLR
jgi:putative hydrolase of the HAD superfamily